MEPLKKLLTLLGYRLVTCEGFEADDILGTLAKACEENGNECVIATGDRDSLQLVSDKTSVHLCSNKQDILYTPEKILETYGVTPKELIEIKAIQGDTSDNIPGVPGIGEKTAVARYHSLAAKKENLPECLKIIGESDNGEIMAISHKNYPVYGLQFHPESILKKKGKKGERR